MKQILFPLIALLLAPLPVLNAAKKPNILLIYSDDHGWADLGAQGVNGDIRTPNLDQLTRDGVRFARGYVSAPQCVPSRAGVLTGRYQQRFGVEDNGRGPLPLAELTIAERLKPAGYITGMVGKWHLDIGAKDAGGGQGRALRVLPEHMPHKQGFDEYWRGEMRQFYASHDLKGEPFADAPHLVADNRFRVVVQTEAALCFLDRRAAQPEQPWFLYLAWYAPHVPLESPEPWFSKTPENLPLKRRQALAMIAGMDDGLGRIRTKLREMGAEKDTLIMFIGDNGAPLGNAWNGSLNLPLIGQKGMLAEGGIRTPFIAAWPGKFPAGAVYDQPVINLDIAATAAALAGQPHDARLDGVNLVPYVSGEKKGAPHEALYWRWGSQAAVLEMPYKLIMLGERERLLFDITTPDGENLARNLATKHPDIATRLEAKLKAWSDTLNPPGLPTRLDPHHEDLFAEHDLIPKPAKSADKKPEPEGSVRGWLCRNGSLALQDGALTVAPAAAAKKARTFITHATLQLPGPVTALVRLRARQAGKGSFSWRTTTEKDFTGENVASCEWAASSQWQEVKATLGVKGTLVHLRMTLPQDSTGMEVQSITLAPAKGKPSVFDFTTAPTEPCPPAMTCSVDEKADTATEEVSRTGDLAGAAGLSYAATSGTALAGEVCTAASGGATWGSAGGEYANGKALGLGGNGLGADGNRPGLGCGAQRAVREGFCFAREARRAASRWFLAGLQPFEAGARGFEAGARGSEGGARGSEGGARGFGPCTAQSEPGAGRFVRGSRGLVAGFSGLGRSGPPSVP